MSNRRNRDGGPKPTDAAIVGIGAVFPAAPNAPAFWANIEKGVDAITDVPPNRWDPDVYFAPDAAVGPVHADRFYCRRGGFVDDYAAFEPTRFGIMPSAVDGAEPDQLLALRTTAEAVADAGGEARLPDRERIGVVFGRGGYMGVATARLDQRVRTAHQLVSVLRQVAPEFDEARLGAVREAFQAALGPERPESSIGLVPSFTASRIANRLDLGGPAYTVDAACATSLLAVDHAVAELASGRCDAVVAGSVHHCHIATLWSVFTQLRALSPAMRIRPFDRSADGTLISEGTGAVVLKRLADAERDGDRVYAVVRGVGVASDGRSASLMSPLVDGQVRALERAWRMAGLDPGSPGALGLLEAHGTGTPLGDEVELETLARVFGKDGPSVVLGSVKSMIGHAMQASGMAGLLKAVYAVHHATLPPTLHVQDPHPGLARTRMRTIDAAEPWPARSGMVRRAGVNAFGFGGVNTHVIVEEPPATRAAALPTTALKPSPQPPAAPVPVPGAPVIPGNSRLVTFAAGDLGELTSLLDDFTARITAGPVPGSTGEASDGSPGGVALGSGPCRLAVVDPTPRRLELASRVVARGEPWRGRSDVWFTPRPMLGGTSGPGGDALGQPGKVAFLFPGLEPETQPPLHDVADAFGLPRLAEHDTDEIVGRALDALGSGRLLAAALERLGVEPDVVAGHSLGEWTAMVVAGMYPTAAVDVFLDSLRPGALTVPDLVYAAVACGAARASTACEAVGGVVVSHENCPHQCVVCGPAEGVRRVLDRLRTDGVLGQELPFRSGFHTPMWEPYLGQVRDAFGRLPLREARVPVWSATSVAPYPVEASEVRDLTVRHLLEPVRFGALAESLYDAGVRAFVQVGAGSLGGFVDDTLRGADVLTVAAHDPRHPGFAGLLRVRAALWVEGRDVAAAPDSAARAPTRTPEKERPGRAAPVNPAAHAPRRAGPTVQLDLGSPIVRLAPENLPVIQPPRGSRPLTNDQSDDPVLAAFAAALDEAGDAVIRTVDAWRPAAPDKPQSQPPPPLSPVPAPAPAPASPQRRTQLREFSLRSLPYVADHCIYEQHDAWPEDSDRFPVVPMTTLLELTGEAARTLVPGRVVAGYQDVRALRWLPVAPATNAEVTATRLDGDRVRVEIAGFTSTVVRLAASPPEPIAPDRTPLTGERPAPVRAAALYSDRWMFHGPGFAGVDEVTAVAEDGIRGVLRSLPAPGALLDAAGQLFGHWMQLSLPTDRLVFPVSIEEVRLYGPPPRTGDRLLATARIRRVTATTVLGDVELRDPGDGLVRAQLLGWTYRRFAADERVWPMKFTPHTTGVGEPQPEGWCLVRTRWPDAASQELVMRRYLGADEREEFATRRPRTRSGWLLGRIAAKDAVRGHLWARGEGPIYPAEIRVRNDGDGRPLVERLPVGEEFRSRHHALHVSIAHKHRLAVALADRVPVGIDIESLSEHPESLERVALAPTERDLLDRIAADDPGARNTWLVRFWCAKEAAGKASGTGLAGRPADARVVRVTEDRLFVAGPDDTLHTVRTRIVADDGDRHVVAWTVPHNPVPSSPVESP
ncbi:beta-ketoacyl synthase N-terminal-like domain-containing protein [Yinghuangia sp. YIM S09857]|uniref:beta-ketoacyl synthase N-terminal-like domain-containing protein n=1 Tax=Yinghuangia sp. YIM S09857 TaxID=3436929 RepID=UPI003F52BF2B